MSSGLIEMLSEDRAIVMQEKKQLEEELNRLRGTALVSSAYYSPNPLALEPTGAGARLGPGAFPGPGTEVEVGAGACSSELFPDPDRLASVAATREDDRVDSAVEASMVTVQ